MNKNDSKNIACFKNVSFKHGKCNISLPVYKVYTCVKQRKYNVTVNIQESKVKITREISNLLVLTLKHPD